jgi:hypothetical protein
LIVITTSVVVDGHRANFLAANFDFPDHARLKATHV